MAPITLTTFLTLDGVMQAPGGPNEDPSGSFRHGGWLVPFADADMGNFMDEAFSKVGAFALGASTYDIFAGHWPRVTDPDDPIAGKLNALPKYVASRTRTEFTWHNSHHLADLAGDLERIRRDTEGELQVHGSCGLARSLIELDLIDEYRLLVFPVVLGSGKRLFDNGAPPASLTLIDSTTTTAGTVISRYRRGGPLRTGSFEL